MDFFAHQEAARRQSKRFVLLFILAVAAIIAAVYVVVGPLWFIFAAGDGFVREWSWWDPDRLLLVALGVSTVIFLGSAYRIMTLKQGGGAAVARLMGGRPVDPDTRDPHERRLLNVVQEMAIASGIPVPAVYLLEGEDSINAFAAGFATDQAVIGVTRGCLKLLSRDELQGVIGHEFSHVLNGDMGLNLRLMGILHGILVIAVIGRLLMRGRRARSKGAAQAQLAGLGLYVVGYAGVFFGTLIKAAVSRQREFLGDASGVQFTRNPGGLAGSLKKIGGLASGSRLLTPHAEEGSHLFFGDAMHRFTGWLSTHPPLRERVARLDPGFDGVFPSVDVTALGAAEPEAREAPAIPSSVPVWRSAAPEIAAIAAAAGALGGAERADSSPAASAGFDPKATVARVGTLDRAHLDHAVALIEALGAPLLERARSLPGALMVIYALLIGREAQARKRQVEVLRSALPPAQVADFVKVLPALEGAPREARLPLMDLAVSTLRRLSPAQFQSFHETVEALVRADDRNDHFELALSRAVLRHVAPAFGGSRASEVRYRSIRSISGEISALLSALARCGQREPEAAQRAFESARLLLGDEAGLIRMLPPEECGVERLERALDELARASPSIKKSLIASATACVMSDRKVTMEEAELLRAFGDALDCPVPPFIPGVEI